METGQSSIALGALPAAGIILVSVFLTVILKRIASWIRPAGPLPYPPGPKPKPIVGNMFDIPTSNMIQEYVRWGDKYKSKILHASSLGNHVVILNSLEDAEELLDRRASNYSNRMELPMVKLLGFHTNMVFMPYGAEWRQHRRVAQQIFRPDAITRQEPIQARRVHLLLKGLLDDPDNFLAHHKVLALSIPLEYMYGYNTQTLDDPFIIQAQKAMDLGLDYFRPNSTLINLFPILGHLPPWFPGATAKKAAATTREILHKLETEPMDMVEQAMKKGIPTPCVLSEFLDSKRDSPTFEEEAQIMKRLALAIYSGASDTMVASLGALFYLLATRPDIQKKAQAEVDGVLKTGDGSTSPTTRRTMRLPDFGDRAAMPYTEALMRELWRYWPTAPMGAPHCALGEDEYRGWYIPRGAVVLPNIWAMTRDEGMYPDPHEFKPERFLDERGRLLDGASSRVLAFGFGRRICPGRYSASSTLWLTIASVLACFDISKAKDAEGNEIEVDDGFVFQSITLRKTPFKCTITPRFEGVRKLVEEAVAVERVQ
ncbi:cytochrome P450 [Pholiota conissans]|uniref:Cytochrome P450 n=1 Tax=Pholiota conissans TaxID=109636 RepID=A0A9P5ZCX1_9AGAR|nr:cytochrome P450 [Pholiota conissans]